MPEVSIIIPTFNRPKLLEKTLRAILAQTYTDYEVIIVSNGSADNVAEEVVINQFQDKRLKYIFQKGSGSPASPRNTGIKASLGNFIAFCDDDDIWLPEKLEKQIDFLIKNAEYNMCYTKMKRFDENTTWINPDEETVDSVNSQKLLRRNTIPLSSIVMRKKILENNECFDEDKKIFSSEDYELTLRLSKKNKFFCIQEYLLLYYSGSARFSNGEFNNSFRKNLWFLSRLFHVYKKVVRKGFFKWHEVVYPFFFHTFFCVKLVLYELYVYCKSRIKGLRMLLIQKYF